MPGPDAHRSFSRLTGWGVQPDAGVEGVAPAGRRVAEGDTEADSAVATYSGGVEAACAATARPVCMPRRAGWRGGGDHWRNCCRAVGSGAGWVGWRAAEGAWVGPKNFCKRRASGRGGRSGVPQRGGWGCGKPGLRRAEACLRADGGALPSLLKGLRHPTDEDPRRLPVPAQAPTKVGLDSGDTEQRCAKLARRCSTRLRWPSLNGRTTQGVAIGLCV